MSCQTKWRIKEETVKGYFATPLRNEKVECAVQRTLPVSLRPFYRALLHGTKSLAV
jgi:hypothetical protein